MKFRALRADEIECRVSQISEKGCALLLYKDARCDMNILDETVGAENWQRKHTRDNANCIVSIWDEKKQQWIEKEDTGTESNTEKEKGQASDSFKRACFNWGIGRELYTAPFIWINAKDFNVIQKNGKYATYDKFIVSEIEIDDKKIVKLSIANAKTGYVCYRWSKNSTASSSKASSNEPTAVPLAAESKEALNSAIQAFVKISGKNINEVMALLKKSTGKSHKQYTEEDAKIALTLLSSWQSKLMEELGV